ncbi:uncharacterized protein LOC132612271 [Lycium barbarum]|uniref:uncharacterized protein LOC132612271 n=1 Tax=Lycium barbarum TaxID=112863 RepID=UPI00293F0ED4|nr:uncharacterized protein LOC132612271 [Lycium barbarum]
MVQKMFKVKKYIEQAGLYEDDLMSMLKFSVKKMYLLMRGVFTKVPWRRMVCNNYGAPKWIFILRLAAHERLYTRDRLVKWGVTKNPDCPLCQNGLETIAHLFFQCTYSATVWRELLKWQGIQRLPMEWTQELKWANEHAKGRNNKAEVYRMVMAASVYHIWIERNNMIFQ